MHRNLVPLTPGRSKQRPYTPARSSLGRGETLNWPLSPWGVFSAAPRSGSSGRAGGVGVRGRARGLRIALALLCITLSFLIGSIAYAQDNSTVAIRAGRIVTVSGPTITNGVVLIKNGKIAALGKDVKIPVGVKVIDARADVVMPGLIAAYSTLAGRTEPDETITPDVCAIEGYDSYSNNARLLEGGLTTAYLSTGAHRLVSGQGAVVKLAGEGPSIRTLRASADVCVQFGAYVKNPPALFRPPIPPTDESPLLPSQRQFPSVRPSEFALLRQLFLDAKRIGSGSSEQRPTSANISPIPPDRNPPANKKEAKLRALAPILSGQEPLRVNAHTAADIRHALEFADAFHLRIVLEGATEGYLVAGDLAKRHIPVVVTAPQRPGRRIGEDFQRESANGKINLRNVATLLQAGVPVALAPTEDSDLTDMLLLAAAQVPYGVSPETALRLVTLNAAEALGVRERVGSLEVGKDADLIILDGAPLATTTHVAMTLVNGKTVYTRAGETPQGTLIAIRAGRILTMTQGEIANGVILLRDGKIVAVRREADIPEGVTVLDASHDVVMPGMMDTHSYLGLHADAEPTPTDLAAPQTGPASGRTKLLDALVPNDPAFTDALRAGVTCVLLAPPTGGPVCGQATLLKTVQDPDHPLTNHGRVVKELAALCFNLQGGAPRMAQPWNFREMLQAAKAYNQRRAQYERDLREWERDRDEAKRQGKDIPKEPAEVPKDEDQEPFAALFRGEIPAFVHVGRADEIVTALKVFQDEFDLPLTLVDAPDSFRVVDEIRKRTASVALGPDVTQRDKGKPINNADVLTRAGIRVLFQTSSASGAQFLRLNAANAVRNGLDPTEALRALTLYPARVLHVEDHLGSIEAGKDADLVILNGDPMDLTSRVEKVLVNGKVVYDAK